MEQDKMGDNVRGALACHGTLLELNCVLPKSLLFIEFALLGRNNSLAATRCAVPFKRNCELDVHFRLNRACAGRSYCTFPVNSKIFGDPCGFGEFLTVGYKCITVENIHSRCNGREFVLFPSRVFEPSSSPAILLPPSKLRKNFFSFSPSFLTPSSPSSSSSSFSSSSSSSSSSSELQPFQNLSRDTYYVPLSKSLLGPSSPATASLVGYISSPNYPHKYQTGIGCTWIIEARPWQSLRVVVSDFELAVKLNGLCQDRLTIASGRKGVVKFDECGPMGKQVIDLEDHRAELIFRSGTSSHGGRGFFLYFEALGPTCGYLDWVDHGRVVYYHEPTDGSLSANMTCSKGFTLKASKTRKSRDKGSTLTLKCLGGRWNHDEAAACLGESTTTGHDLAVTSHQSFFRIGHVTTIHYALTFGTSSLVLTAMLVVACLIYKRRDCFQRPSRFKRVAISSLDHRENFSDRSFERRFNRRDADNDDGGDDNDTCTFHEEPFARWRRHKRGHNPGEGRFSSEVPDEETKLNRASVDGVNSDASMPNKQPLLPAAVATAAAATVSSFDSPFHPAATVPPIDVEPDLTLTCLTSPTLHLFNLPHPLTCLTSPILHLPPDMNCFSDDPAPNSINRRDLRCDEGGHHGDRRCFRGRIIDVSSRPQRSTTLEQSKVPPSKFQPPTPLVDTRHDKCPFCRSDKS